MLYPDMLQICYTCVWSDGIHFWAILEHWSIGASKNCSIGSSSTMQHSMYIFHRPVLPRYIPKVAGGPIVAHDIISINKNKNAWLWNEDDFVWQIYHHLKVNLSVICSQSGWDVGEGMVANDDDSDDCKCHICQQILDSVWHMQCVLYFPDYRETVESSTAPAEEDLQVG